MQKFFLYLFAALLVFVSYDVYLADTVTIKLNSIFIYKGFGINSLNVYNIVLILYLALTYFKYKPAFIAFKGFQLFFFIVTLLCLFLNVANPNNYEIRAIFFSIDQYIILIIIIIFSVLNEEQFFDFIKSLFTAISIFLIIRAIILLVLWSVGKGQKGFFGVNSSVTESDTLITYYLFQSVFFMLFLIYKRTKYILVWGLFFLIQLFSYRRTNMLNSMIFVVFMYIIYSFFVKPDLNKVINVILIFSTIVLISIPIYNQLPLKQRIWVDRYLSAIPGFETNIKAKGLDDSGHWEQTTKTSNQILSGKFKFWGIGEGQWNKKKLQGQTSAVHNIFAASWFYNGFHYFIYVLIIYFINIFLFFKFLFQILFQNRRDTLTFFKLGLSITMLLYLVGMFFAMLWFFEHHRIGIFWIIILFFLAKVNNLSVFNSEENESIVVH